MDITIELLATKIFRIGVEIRKQPILDCASIKGDFRSSEGNKDIIRRWLRQYKSLDIFDAVSGEYGIHIPIPNKIW